MFNWFKRKINKQVGNTLKAMSVNLGTTAVYVNNDLKKLYENSYNTNVDLYSVIKTIAEKFGQLPRYEYKKEKVKRRKNLDENVIDSDLTKLLQRPNDHCGADEFFEAVCTHYLLSGEAIIWKNRGGLPQGRILEMYVMPTQNMEAVASKTVPQSIVGWIFDNDGQRIPIPVEDIIHWKNFNPNYNRHTGEHLRGFSPLIPQKKVLTQSNSSTDAMVAMFQNGGARGAFVNKSFDSFDEVQMGQVQDVIDGKFNSNRVKAAIALLQGDWSYLDIGKDAVDMQLVEANEMIVKKICHANGLPHEIFQTDTTFANKEQAWMFFITNKLMPLASSLDNKLNYSLVPDFTTGGIIATDFSDLPEMADMKKKMVDAANTAWWLTPNEKRKLMMEEEIIDGNMDKIYIPSGYTELGQANEPIRNDVEFDE